MTDTYDLTNPITDALGDQHTLREVTMINHSSIARIEPLTNTSLPPGQTVLVRVIGDIGHEQLINQLQQINELKGFEVIGVTSVPVTNDVQVFSRLLNAVESSEKLTYTSGTLGNGLVGWTAVKPWEDGESIKFIVPALLLHQWLLIDMKATDAFDGDYDLYISFDRLTDGTTVLNYREADDPILLTAGDEVTVIRSGQMLVIDVNGQAITTQGYVNYSVPVDAFLRVTGYRTSTAPVPGPLSFTNIIA